MSLRNAESHAKHNKHNSSACAIPPTLQKAGLVAGLLMLVMGYFSMNREAPTSETIVDGTDPAPIAEETRS